MSGIYDLVILDVNLPKMNGFEVLERVRDEGNQTLILMLTARSQIDDKVEGLTLGADDYLPKPFATKELLARIKALLRRSQATIGDVKVFGDISYDSLNFRLSKEHKSVDLTHLEGQLLDLLMTRKHMIISKDMIISKLWGFDTRADDNNVEVYIFFLRKKLKYLNSDVVIKTSRGIGYSLEVKKDV
jgi:DNA-binding response OmpR family regulator